MPGDAHDAVAAAPATFPPEAIDRLQRYRDERIAAILKGGGGSRPLGPGSKLIIHLVPLAALTEPGIKIDPKNLGLREHELGPPASGDHHDGAPNGAGYRRHKECRDRDHCTGYVQLLRNGAIIEAACSGFLGVTTPTGDPMETFRPQQIETDVVEAVDRYLAVQQHLAVPCPIAAGFTVRGIEAMLIGNKVGRNGEPEFIDDDRLAPDEVFIPDYDTDPARLLRGAFNHVWQAAGLRESKSYDPRGEWIDPGGQPRRRVYAR